MATNKKSSTKAKKTNFKNVKLITYTKKQDGANEYGFSDMYIMCPQCGIYNEFSVSVQFRLKALTNVKEEDRKFQFKSAEFFDNIKYICSCGSCGYNGPAELVEYVDDKPDEQNKSFKFAYAIEYFLKVEANNVKDKKYGTYNPETLNRTEVEDSIVPSTSIIPYITLKNLNLHDFCEALSWLSASDKNFIKNYMQIVTSSGIISGESLINKTASGAYSYYKITGTSNYTGYDTVPEYFDNIRESLYDMADVLLKYVNDNGNTVPDNYVLPYIKIPNFSEESAREAVNHSSNRKFIQFWNSHIVYNYNSDEDNYAITINKDFTIDEYQTVSAYIEAAQSYINIFAKIYYTWIIDHPIE